MKIEISQKILSAYKNSGKNPNYSLNFILNSLDSSVCKEWVTLPDNFEFQGATFTFEIDEKNVKIVQALFGQIDTTLIERLLWIAYLLPEM